MRIYLDACCLHRPLDDQSQHRVRLESEAIRLTLEMCGQGLHRWVSSEVIEDEVLRNPDEEKRAVVLGMLRFSDERLSLDERSIALAHEFTRQRIGRMDALHLALADTARCDVLLTTDDQFVSRAGELRPPTSVKVANPARWVLESTSNGA